ncbi:catechol-2,3-dioxygenase [Methylopila jiangsuensis]|uniref:Catechol-2,3-dioxygenase n=1 Tax=Methylopila jiangsuensis TaxID=586230 RepID=A0A9W6JIF2_9HYPH|nr:VOC family protein [Methylopila jiangsuensis]MDR6284375.1 catechol 2,3-dioxygenase [Methylopila jiangsuensis]GLK78240.1 catechol-2,3-dioxygenase [Methylopila jiangsuensis]
MAVPSAAPRSAASTLPAGLALGVAELAVSSLPRSVAFYERVVGLRRLSQEPGVAELGGTGGPAVLRLVERPGAAPKPREAAGLFHVAILLPERRNLAITLARLVRERLRIGASDHLVSEALYLDDPDGNGIEIYRDRPRGEWTYRAGEIAMATEPLDAEALLDLLAPGVDLDAAQPAGTRVGHIHLQVGDLAAARAFWIDAIGFEPTTTYPGAVFMSAGGYHHHLAANVWASRGRGPAPEGSTGLLSFEAILPDAAAVEALATRLDARGVAYQRDEDALRVADPWGTTIVFVVG